MSFPQLVPTSRSFDAGDYPVKAFKSQDGAEVRILYGSRRVGMSLRLSYQNIPDASAKLFIEHFHNSKGTYQQFTLGDGSGAAALKGWAEAERWLDAEAWGSRWRYASAPQLDSVYPGISTVIVELVAATV